MIPMSLSLNVAGAGAWKTPEVKRLVGAGQTDIQAEPAKNQQRKYLFHAVRKMHCPSPTGTITSTNCFQHLKITRKMHCNKLVVNQILAMNVPDIRHWRVPTTTHACPRTSSFEEVNTAARWSEATSCRRRLKGRPRPETVANAKDQELISIANARRPPVLPVDPADHFLTLFFYPKRSPWASWAWHGHQTRRPTWGDRDSHPKTSRRW